MNRIFKLSAYLIETDEFYKTSLLEEIVSFVRDEFVDWAITCGFRRVDHLHIQCADLNECDIPGLLEHNCDLSLCERHFQNQASAKEHDRPIPKSGEHWKHFKVGKIVEILAVSRCTEAPDSFSVIYRGPDGIVWDRPLDMFMSEVDHEKYPDHKEKYRFSKV